jgi:aquaporin Z
MWFANKMTNSAKMSGATAESERGTLHRRDSLKAFSSLRVHWPEYLMEAGELGLYMFFTCVFATLLRHPASPLRHFIVGDVSRRVLMGSAMGVTAIAIVMSPWGKQSGAHFNPGITVAFFWLGKVELWDAFWYATGQFLGGISGVAIATAVLRGAPGEGTVRYAVTVPGVYGDGAAFVAELIISFILMSAILFTSNRESLSPYTPYFSGALIAVYLTLEAPLSGASTNPARSLGSALHAGYWHALWIYFVAPPLGMLAAAEVFLRARGGVAPRCAKLYHASDKRCIFHCDYRTARAQNPCDPRKHDRNIFDHGETQK